MADLSGQLARGAHKALKFRHFGENGEGFVRVALVENELRLKQAVRQIDRALLLGYDVVVVNLWDMDQKYLEHLNGSIAAPTRIRAMWNMLHRDYDATELPRDPVLGSFYRLTAKPGR